MRYASDTMKCVICNVQGVDIHHIWRRKSGGTDDNWNLIPLCRKHHTEIHTLGEVTSCVKYESYHQAKIERGWEYDILSGWWHKGKRK